MSLFAVSQVTEILGYEECCKKYKNTDLTVLRFLISNLWEGSDRDQRTNIMMCNIFLSFSYSRCRVINNNSLTSPRYDFISSIFANNSLTTWLTLLCLYTINMAGM